MIRWRRVAAGALTATAVLTVGAAACEDGLGVPEQSEQNVGSGNGGERGEDGAPGQGGAGDGIGGV
ncbi:hypothetical protein [Pseudonocardia sp.]|uniref:hypothetical protein n=1 Tax=Pseudonocardia sp. TaxID=60912 RepID=UPI002605E4E2|nr:hypothetical protein [Pseudonocardia sp.]